MSRSAALTAPLELSALASNEGRRTSEVLFFSDDDGEEDEEPLGKGGGLERLISSVVLWAKGGCVDQLMSCGAFIEKRSRGLKEDEEGDDEEEE